jgi:hypothetical protein
MFRRKLGQIAGIFCFTGYVSESIVAHFSKSDPEPVQNRPDLQHCHQLSVHANTDFEKETFETLYNSLYTIHPPM